MPEQKTCILSFRVFQYFVYSFLHMSKQRTTTSPCDPSTWVKNYADDLFRFAVTKVNDPTLAEDLVQDSFLSALKALGQFKGESNEKTWLISILKNKIIDHYRNKARQREFPEHSLLYLHLDETETGNAPFFDEQGSWHKDQRPLNWGIDEEHPLDNPEFKKVLNHCLEKLPSNWLAVFKLKFMEAKESKEICKELSLSASNYWVIMHRAKLQLRACLEKKWFHSQQ